MQRMKVWDLPVRLFHWGIVLLILAAWVSQEFGRMDIHMWIGEWILALLLFRIVWGLIGSDTARFSRFLQSPMAALRHLSHIRRREPDTEVGHNAAGGWMVLVMLLLVLLPLVLLVVLVVVLQVGGLRVLVSRRRTRTRGSFGWCT